MPKWIFNMDNEDNKIFDVKECDLDLEQRLFAATSTPSSILQLLAAFIITGLIFGLTSTTAPLIWLACLLIFVALRHVILTGNNFPLRKLKFLALLSTTLIGLCWGLLPYIIFPLHNTEIHVIIGAAIIFLCAESLTKPQFYFPMYISFLLPSLLPYLVSSLMYQDILLVGFSLLVFLVMGVFIYFGKRKEARSKPPPPAETFDGKRHRILIVDDSYIGRRVTRKMLEQSNFSVTETASGLQALGKLSCENFDLVLMDISMPNMDGFEVVKIIRSLGEDYNNLPVIALTALGQDELKQEMLSSGVNGYLSKPTEKATLLKEISRHIGTTARSGKVVSAVAGGSGNPALDTLIEDVGKEATLRLVQAYINEAEQRFITMSKMLLENQLDRLECESHALKSASYNFGLMAVGDLMARIETLCGSGEKNEIERILPEANYLFRQARKTLSDL